MTETEHTSPTIPSWFNIDAICPPELRAEAATIAEEVEAAIGPFRDLCVRATAMQRTLDEVERVARDQLVAIGGKDSEEGVRNLISQICGSARIDWALCMLDQVASIASEVQKPELVENAGRDLPDWKVWGYDRPPTSAFDMMGLRALTGIHEDVARRIEELTVEEAGTAAEVGT